MGFLRSGLLQRFFVFRIDQDVAGQGGDPLDQLGDPLKRQQPEAENEDELDRPADQAAGIGRDLMLLVRGQEKGPAEQVRKMQAGIRKTMRPMISIQILALSETEP